jgi:predicted GTPase
MSEWKSTTTAPAGRDILLFAVTDVSNDGKIRNWKMGSGWKQSDGQWFWPDRLNAWDHIPTHWTDMPPPPEGCE